MTRSKRAAVEDLIAGYPTGTGLLIYDWPQGWDAAPELVYSRAPQRHSSCHGIFLDPPQSEWDDVRRWLAAGTPRRRRTRVAQSHSPDSDRANG